MKLSLSHALSALRRKILNRRGPSVPSYERACRDSKIVSVEIKYGGFVAAALKKS